ncbi:MAG: NYN domain-containing protein [Acidobacteria bacterium]|nr:NYN domain-containing protein [Acidobacteriota bacterium]
MLFGDRMRTSVYIDGLNLYYGALKGTPFKWLDPIKLSAAVLPRRCAVDRVLYFSAHVSGVVDRGAPARQQVYLNALRTLPQVEVHFGSFLAKTFWRPLVNLPVAGRRIATPMPVTLAAGDHTVSGPTPQTLPVGHYPARPSGKKKRPKATAPLPDALVAEFHSVEEKGSDVNLASHLLNDAWKGLFDAAAVVSNDTDLVTPIRMVTAERGKPVFIVCPGRWHAAPKLRQAASHVRHVRKAMLAAAQFPSTLPGTGITKPSGW